MADTFTVNYEFTKPEVGGSPNTWGAKWNDNLDDIDTEIKTVSDASLKKDGTAAATANIPMGGFKLTGLAAGSSAGENLAYNQSVARLASLGLGMVPSNILDITQTVNGNSSIIQLQNAGTGQASSQLRLTNGTHLLGLVMHGTGFATSGPDRQDGARLFTDGAGGFSFDIPSDAHRWYIGGTNYAGLSTSNFGGPGWAMNHDTGSGGSMAVSGFGITCTYNYGGIFTFNGGGFQVVNNANGVSLAINGSSWGAISDYRAKNVVGEFTDSGAIIDAVPVHLASLKKTPDNVKAMFLAHEVQAKVPYAVHGEKDGDKMQYLESTDPLVPILWAEVQSLRERLAAAGL